MQKISLLSVCAKYICILGTGKICSAMWSTVFISHPPAHPTSHPAFLSSCENPVLFSEAKPDKQREDGADWSPCTTKMVPGTRHCLIPRFRDRFFRDPQI